MADTWSTKQNDTKPLYSHLEDADRRIDLTNASAVVFNMRDLDGVVKVNRGVCSIEDATSGYVKYPFIAVDTDTVGSFKGEFEVTWSDSVVETYPDDEYVIIIVVDDIA